MAYHVENDKINNFYAKVQSDDLLIDDRYLKKVPLTNLISVNPSLGFSINQTMVENR